MTTSRRLRAAIAATAIAATALCGAASAATQAGQGFDPATTDRIDRAASAAFNDAGSPGYAVAVTVPGRGVYVRAYGVASRRTGAALQVEDHFRIGSITKTMTGVAVLRLIDQGRLSLDDHLATYVTGVANGARITMRQLLGMRAGVHDFTADPAFADASLANPAMRWTPSDSVRAIRRGAPEYPPGTSGRYDNSNYVLLGRVLERVTGQPVRDVLRDEVLVPAGLADTTLPTTTGMPGPFRRGYMPASRGRMRDTTTSNPDIPWTAGMAISSLEDMTTWARVLGSGALLSPALRAAQEQGRPLQGPAEGRTYGLGLVVNADGWRGHTGYVFGYNSAIQYDPATGSTIVTTGANGADAALEGIKKALAEN